MVPIGRLIEYLVIRVPLRVNETQLDKKSIYFTILAMNSTFNHNQVVVVSSFSGVHTGKSWIVPVH